MQVGHKADGRKRERKTGREASSAHCSQRALRHTACGPRAGRQTGRGGGGAPTVHRQRRHSVNHKHVTQVVQRAGLPWQRLGAVR